MDADLRGYQDESERPGLSAVLRRAAARDYDLLLIWDVSRLARNVEYQERWIRLLAMDGIEVESATEPHVRNTPLVRQMLGAVAEHRTREISASARRSLAKRADRGLPHGIVPWGYRRGTKDEPLQLVDDERVVAAIRRMFELAAAGTPTTRIAAWLQDEGLRTPRGHANWGYHTVQRMLRNPVYRGASHRAARIVEDAHPAIVDADLWRRAQAGYPNRKRAPRRSTAETWLHGLVVHGCGRPMYVVHERAHGGRCRVRCRAASANMEWPGAPQCPVAPRSVWLDDAEPAIWAAVADAVAHVLPLAAVVREQRRRYRESAPAAGARRRELEERRARVAERRDRAERLYLDGVRDRAWFDVEESRLSAELEAIDGAVAALPAPPDEISLAARHAELRELRPLLDRIPEARRGEVLRQLGVAVLDGAGWRIRFHPEWEPLFPSRLSTLA